MCTSTTLAFGPLSRLSPPEVVALLHLAPVGILSQLERRGAIEFASELTTISLSESLP